MKQSGHVNNRSTIGQSVDQRLVDRFGDFPGYGGVAHQGMAELPHTRAPSFIFSFSPAKCHNMEKLNCWVYGEDVENILPVNISSSETVYDLKKVIKDENSLQVQAKYLELYSICLPDDEQLEGKLNRWDHSKEMKLTTRSKLSTLFPKSKEGVWFIIVRAPSSFSRKIEVPNLTLCCWVRGDRSSVVFYVKVSSSETVYDLKTVIKNERFVTFRDVEATNLELYKVSFPYEGGDSLEGVLSNLTSPSLENPLEAGQQLSDVFTQPPARNQLHLIIDVLSVECWIRGADLAGFIKVTIPAEADIGDLNASIKAAYSGIIPFPGFRVYKVTANNDDELHEILGATGSGQMLQGTVILKEVFDDVPFLQMPRVVVELLDEKITGHPPSAYRHVGNGDPIATARNKFLISTPKEKPSATGTPSEFRRRQNNSQHLKSIPCGRPREYEETIPVTLLHPVFGQFLDDCQTIDVTADDNSFVEHLAIAMSALYENENGRLEAVDKVFQKYRFHFTITKTKTTAYITDADMQSQGHRYVIAEYKNETGNASAEPYFQAIGYYLEGTRDKAVKFSRSPLPCLLLAIF
ncbi:hypothetical protein SERLADRAFT_438622, partial [Serpula lacrymans var. lacrymans S7.9]